MNTADEIFEALVNGKLGKGDIGRIVAQRDHFIKQYAIAELALMLFIKSRHPEAPNEVLVEYYRAAIEAAMDSPNLDEVIDSVMSRYPTKEQQ